MGVGTLGAGAVALFGSEKFVDDAVAPFDLLAATVDWGTGSEFGESARVVTDSDSVVMGLTARNWTTIAQITYGSGDLEGALLNAHAFVGTLRAANDTELQLLFRFAAQGGVIVTGERFATVGRGGATVQLTQHAGLAPRDKNGWDDLPSVLEMGTDIEPAFSFVPFTFGVRVWQAVGVVPSDPCDLCLAFVNVGCACRDHKYLVEFGGWSHSPWRMEGASTQRACMALSAPGSRRAAVPQTSASHPSLHVQATDAIATKHTVHATPSNPVTDNREKAIVEWDYDATKAIAQKNAVAHPTASEVYGAMRSDERTSGFVVPVSSEYDALWCTPSTGCSLFGVLCVVAHVYHLRHAGHS